MAHSNSAVWFIQYCMNEILQDILNDVKFQEGVAWQRREFQMGDTIIHKGELGDTLFFIESGMVRVLGEVELETKRCFKPGFCDLQAGEMFGEICLYSSHVQTTSVSALVTSRLLLIDGQRFNVFLDDHPVQGYLFFRALFHTMTQRLLLANHRIEHLLAWGLKVHDIDKHLS